MRFHIVMLVFLEFFWSKIHAWVSTWKSEASDTKEPSINDVPSQKGGWGGGGGLSKF